MSTEDDPKQLRERVREQHARIEALEQTVADLQDSDDSTATSTRRSILGSAAAAAGLGGLGYGVRQAQAQASGPAGQVGTDSEPVDVNAWDLDVQGQVTRDIDFGGYGVTNGGSFDVEKASIAERSLFAYLSSSQTVSDSSNTTVEFDVEIHDNLNAWDTGGFEFTAPADGSYLFYVHLALVPSGSFSGERSQVQLNGPTNRRDDERDVNKSGKFTQDILVVYDLSQGQTVNVEYFQESGGNVDVNASTAGDSYLTVSKVG